jgi:integrase/recombinase XerC
MTWLDGQVRGLQLAELTRDQYRSKIGYWLTYLENIARTDRPTPATVQAYLVSLADADHHPATVNAYINAVKAFYRWCESGDLYPSIARSIRSIKEYRDGPLPALTHEQVVTLVQDIGEDTLQQLRDKTMIALMYSTAFRCVSLVRADIEDVDLDQNRIRHQPKGHLAKDAATVFPLSVSDLLQRYLAKRQSEIGTPLSSPQPLFVALDRRCAGRRLTTKSVRAIVLKYMELAGYAHRRGGKLINPGVFSAHCLRRSASVTTAKKSGLEVAQGLLGHASIETTRKSYARSELDQQLKENASNLDPL